MIDRVKCYCSQGPFVILFLGPNGTKVANLLRKNAISVVLAATNTHRAAAIEQLQEHDQELCFKVIAQKYGADPSAVARDAIEYATKHAIQVTLIDSAGRINNSKPLMSELNKVIRVTNQI